jgi:glycosyltransferase involved in cell wall biosynthesis
VSEDTNRETIRRGVSPERSVALYSGLDLEPYRRMPSRDEARARLGLGIPPGVPVISNVARMWPEKALSALVDAAAKLRQKYPTLQVLQVGDGLLMEPLKAQVARLGLQDCVRLLGFRTDYAEIMRASDIFALPSLAEGMPMVIYSAMALGLPIVTSDVNGMRDTLTHEKSALIMRPGDADDLAAAVDRLLSDSGLAQRIGAEAKRVMEQRFSAEHAVRELESLYDRVLAARGMPNGLRQVA